MMCPGSSMWFYTGMTPSANATNRLATERWAKTPGGDLPWVGSQTDQDGRLRGGRTNGQASEACGDKIVTGCMRRKYRVQVTASFPVGRWPQG